MIDFVRSSTKRCIVYVLLRVPFPVALATQKMVVRVWPGFKEA